MTGPVADFINALDPEPCVTTGLCDISEQLQADIALTTCQPSYIAAASAVAATKCYRRNCR